MNNGQLYLYRNYYTSSLRKYNDIDTYIALFRPKHGFYNLQTDTEIRFSSKLKFGSTSQEVKKEMSSSYYKASGKTSLNITILIYKTKIGNNKAKLELHFYMDKLFYFNYTFKKGRVDITSEIIETICKKYLTNTNTPPDFSNNCISDSQNNRIEIIEDSEKMTIHYLSNDYSFITKAKEEKEERNRKINHQELYSKL